MISGYRYPKVDNLSISAYCYLEIAKSLDKDTQILLLHIQISLSRGRIFFCEFPFENKNIFKNILGIYSCTWYVLSIHEEKDFKNPMLVSL